MSLTKFISEVGLCLCVWVETVVFRGCEDTDLYLLTHTDNLRCVFLKYNVYFCVFSFNLYVCMGVCHICSCWCMLQFYTQTETVDDDLHTIYTQFTVQCVLCGTHTQCVVLYNTHLCFTWSVLYTRQCKAAHRHTSSVAPVYRYLCVLYVWCSNFVCHSLFSVSWTVFTTN